MHRNYYPINDVRREFGRIFGDLLNTSSSQRALSENYFTPACNVEESTDHYLLTLEMAGVKNEDIKMEIMDQQLTISGERRNEVQKTDQGYSYSEINYGKFQRSFTLPQGVDDQQVEAQYQDGVLSIVIPKVEKVKPKQIPIKNGGTSKFLGKFFSSSLGKEETHSASKEKAAS